MFSIKAVISTLLKSHVGTFLTGLLMQRKAVVFTLHRFKDDQNGVTGYSSEYLDQALSYLHDNGYQFISLEALIDTLHKKKSLPRKAVCFTLDDGHLDQATIAIPVFEKYNCPVTIFLITKFTSGQDWPWFNKIRYIFTSTTKKSISLNILGKSINFDFSIKSPIECSREYIALCKTLPESELYTALDILSHEAGIAIPVSPVRSAQPIPWYLARSIESKNVKFAPHSATHIVLSRLSQERATEEMHEAWCKLEENLSDPLKVFCFPNGRRDEDFTNRDLLIAKRLGYSAVLTTDHSYVNENKKDKYIIDRVNFPEEMSELIKVISKIDFINIIYKNTIVRPLTNIYGGKRGFSKYYSEKFKDSIGMYSRYRDIDWGKVERFVFICYGNICRSIYAEKIMSKYSHNSISYGVDTESGKPANIKAITIADGNNVDLKNHMTKRIEEYYPQDGDLVVAMEYMHLKIFNNKINSVPDIQQTLLGLWSIEQGNPYIHDPYGCSDAYFRQCFDRIESCIKGMNIYMEMNRA